LGSKRKFFENLGRIHDVIHELTGAGGLPIGKLADSAGVRNRPGYIEIFTFF
jgi:hypothetical protein